MLSKASGRPPEEDVYGDGDDSFSNGGERHHIYEDEFRIQLLQFDVCGNNEVRYDIDGFISIFRRVHPGVDNVLDSRLHGEMMAVFDHLDDDHDGWIEGRRMRDAFGRLAA